MKVPELGSFIGELASWNAHAISEEGPDVDYYSFAGVFQWIQSELFHDPEYPHEVIVQLRHSTFRLEPAPGSKIELLGRALTMEKVKLCPIEQ